MDVFERFIEPFWALYGNSITVDDPNGSNAEKSPTRKASVQRFVQLYELSEQ